MTALALACVAAVCWNASPVLFVRFSVQSYDLPVCTLRETEEGPFELKCSSSIGRAALMVDGEEPYAILFSNVYDTGS